MHSNNFVHITVIFTLFHFKATQTGVYTKIQKYPYLFTQPEVEMKTTRTAANLHAQISITETLQVNFITYPTVPVMISTFLAPQTCNMTPTQKVNAPVMQSRAVCPGTA